MKHYRIVIIIAIIAIAAIIAGCSSSNKSAASGGGNQARTQSQSQGNGGGGSGAFAAFRESHKYTFMLTRMVGNLGRLEAESDAKLTPEQAKTMLAVLEPLRTQPSLTQDDAKDALKKLKAVLTEQQLTEIGKMKQPERRQGQGLGRSGGSGQRRAFDPSTMQDFNPFNPPKDSPMAGRSGGRMNEFFDMLKAKAGK